MDISGADVALEPMIDVADEFVVDVFASLWHRSPNDDDVNADASDDLMEFAF